MRSQICIDGLPSGAVLRASRPGSVHIEGVRVERAAQRTDVPQVPQESDTFRQSDVLVEARERAVQHRRDLPFLAHKGHSPAPTFQSLHAPVPEGPVAEALRVELAVLRMPLPDDMLVPDGNVLTVREVRQHESCCKHTCDSRKRQVVQVGVLAAAASELCRCGARVASVPQRANRRETKLAAAIQ